MKTLIGNFATYFTTTLTAFFMPISWAITSVLCVVLIDTLTGIISAGKKGIKEIKSRKLGNVISKIIYYISAVILCRIAELFIDDSIPFVKMALVSVMIIEIKSIDENFRSTFNFSFIDTLLTSFKKLNRK